VLDSVAPSFRKRLELVSLVIGSIATAYLAWSACLFTYESWEFQDVAQGMLAMPLWIPQLSFAFGAVLLWIAVVDELLLVLRGETPTFVRAVAERHAKGDFSSDI
jgi:TRAP-type C4-dicarboxylate transport system permease small subunit